MSNDYTKTDRVLLLVQSICKAPRLTLSDAKVRDILGNPSKAQYHKVINELTGEIGERKAILLKRKDSEGNISFQLNECDWIQYIEGSQEIHYILNSYKELGHLFPKIDVDGVSVHSKNLDRKFHYLSQVKLSEASKNIGAHLEMVIKALIGNRRLLIRYKDTNREKEKFLVEIFPLTVVQYRDDLYLVAFKSEMKDENLRHYKISRILEVVESKDKFKYPSSSRWDPKDYFKNRSGIFVGNDKKAHFKAYNESKDILIEKAFFNSSLISQTKDYDEYECTYSNIEEFMGFLFIYGQDIEIVGNEILKKAFRDKAEKILKRNADNA